MFILFFFFSFITATMSSEKQGQESEHISATTSSTELNEKPASQSEIQLVNDRSVGENVKSMNIDLGKEVF